MLLALLPIDIHNKQFKKGVFGFNEDEVNEFLQEVMKDYDILLRDKKNLEAEINDLKTQVGHYSNLEETLNKSIVVAQEAAEEVKTSANKEAELIVQEAEKNANRIINESLEEARQIRIEMETIKKQAVVFRTRLKMLIEAQLDLVNKEEWNQFLDVDEKTEEKVDMKPVNHIETSVESNHPNNVSAKLEQADGNGITNNEQGKDSNNTTGDKHANHIS